MRAAWTQSCTAIGNRRRSSGKSVERSHTEKGKSIWLDVQTVHEIHACTDTTTHVFSEHENEPLLCVRAFATQPHENICLG